MLLIFSRSMTYILYNVEEGVCKNKSLRIQTNITDKDIGVKCLSFSFDSSTKLVKGILVKFHCLEVVGGQCLL